MDDTVELRLYGHRGASVHEPENTMAAFERALSDGANALELDIHPTADGHFVVAHDPDGRRTAGIDAAIRDLTLAEVGRWRLGPASHRVPTLTEVLEAFPEVPMSVDLKPDLPQAVPALLEVLAKHSAEPHVTLASFSSLVVRTIRRLGYRGRTALSRAEVAYARFLPAAVARRRIAGDAAHIPVVYHSIRLDGRRFIRRCRRLGLRVEYWTIETPAEARRLLDAGATGIMTDDPARIAPVFHEFGNPNADCSP